MGPIVVQDKFGKLDYQLNLGIRTHPVFYVSLLHRYHPGRDGRAISTPIMLQGEQEWPVDWILRHQCRGQGQWEYLVSYVDYGQSMACWLLEEDL